jgi:hypothetical protein
MTLATVVDVTALWQTTVAAIGAGLGVILAYSLAMLGVARFVDLSRDGRTAAAALSGALAILALAVVGAAVVLGIIVMASK